MTSYEACCVAYCKKHPEDLGYITRLEYKQLYEQYKHMSIDELRTAACKTYAYCFARDIDEEFHYETYQVCMCSSFEKLYYKNVMKIDITAD